LNSMPEQKLLSPTYQDILILTLNTTLTRLMIQDYKGAWIGLKTIYHALPPTSKGECKANYEKMANYLTEIPKQQTNMYFEAYEIGKKEEEFIAKEAWNLFEKFKDSLFKEGYLVLEVGSKPRNPEPTTLGEQVT
jgi:hypothetical protein